MRAAYGKASHAAALERAGVLRQRLAALNETHRVAAHLFYADATDACATSLRNSASTWSSDKRQKIAHESYERLERLRIGKRQIVLLKPRA